MPKDRPIRNPELSPAGLSRDELARHSSQVVPRGPSTPSETRAAAEHCRYVTSYGGVSHCGDAPYLDGFCRFHYHCLARGEISPLGRILDVVKDQTRRREINQHGIDIPALDRVPEDPLTGTGGSGAS